MKLYFYLALNLSIFIPGIVALYRYRSIERSYYPFIYCLWLGCLNETISTYLIFNYHQTLINNNIYVLTESILLLWFFYRTRLSVNKNIFYLLAGVFLAIWISENFIFRSINVNSTYFRIFYSFVIVLLSINTINQNIFTKKSSLLTDPAFIICTGFIIYFTYKVVVQAFAIYGFSRQSSFLLNIYIIMYYINFTVNIIYTIAIIWMRRKIKYSFQSLLQSS
jgi:hypothetical protein